MATNSRNMNPAAMSVQLSPPRVSKPKKVTKQRKKLDDKPGLFANENAKNVLYDQLLKDPEKKRMVLKLLQDNQKLIKQYMTEESGPSSPVNNVKNVVRYESPTALMKRRQFENTKKFQLLGAARDAVHEDHKQLTSHAVTPTRKPTKKTLLKGVHAFVEVMDVNHVNRSEGVEVLLQKLGGTVATKLTNSCSHVIYKDGTYETFKKAKQLKIPLVSLLWLDVMDRNGFRVPHDMYPAMGDYQSKETCNQICEKLNSKDKRHTLHTTKNTNNTTRRQTLPSHTFQLDENYLATLDGDDDPDFIANSQPESFTGMLGMSKMGKTLPLYTIDDNSDSNSGAISDAPSDEPLISGLPTRKTRDELEQSLLLSKTLLDSPHITKKRGRPRKTDTFDCKENYVKTPTKTSLFKDITKRKASARKNVGTKDVIQETAKNNDDSGNDMGNMSPPETSTPIVTKPTRKTLLHPEALGIVVDETNNKCVSMELTHGKSRLSRTKSSNKTPQKRLTNAVIESMDLTNIEDADEPKDDRISKMINISAKRNTMCPSNTTPFDLTTNTSANINTMCPADITPPDLTSNKTRRKTTNASKTSVDSKVKSTGKDNSTVSVSTPKKVISSTKVKEKVNNEEPIKQTVNKTTRSSTSSTRTSASDDLMTYASRRITRRMSTHIKLHAASNASGTEEMSPLQISNNASAGESKSKLSVGINELSSNISRKTGSSAVPSLRLSTNSDDLKNSSTSSTEQPKNVSNCENIETDVLMETSVDKEKSCLSTSSSRPSLRLCISTEEAKNSSIGSSHKGDTHASDKQPSVENVNLPVESPNNVNMETSLGDANTKRSDISSIPSMRLRVENEINTDGTEAIASGKNIAVSPVSNLSRQLFNTSIGSKPVMHSNTFETASTSYSIVDATATTATRESTRSKSGPSAIININTSRSTVSSKATSSSSIKRKLCHPDDLVSENGDDADEERRVHSQLLQNKATCDTMRKTLKVRLDNLNIPDKVQEGTGGVAGDDDGDFWDPVALTQRTQREKMRTQATQSTRMKSIVCTRFHSDQIIEFRQIVNELGEFRIEQDVTAKTTHVVAMEPSRTLNMLRAMSRGIWILRGEWLFDSMKAGKWKDEDTYEMTEFSPFVQELRLQRETFNKAFCHDVFVDCGAIYVSPTCHPSRHELQELIMLCKGKTTDQLQEAVIIIGGVDGAQRESQTCVREAWILDCITFGRCKKFKNYLLTIS